MFSGEADTINGIKAEHMTDILGNPYSFIDIVCQPREFVTAEVKDEE